METQSVRIDKNILNRIRKLVKHSKQPVSAFVNIVLDWKVTQMEQDEEVLGYHRDPNSMAAETWMTKKQHDSIRPKKKS